MTRIDECLKFILRWEGGNVDDPADRGGRTSRGVTQRTYDAYRRKRGVALRDVWTAEDSEVRDVYLEHYWSPCGCSSMPAPLDLAVFDAAVNCGGRRAVKWLQIALGMDSAEVDGVMGAHTLQHILECVTAGELDRVVERFMNLRGDHYDNLVEADPRQSRFIKGWKNRLASLETEMGVA